MCPLLAVGDALAGTPPPVLPEPVESWARRDLRADRRARAGLIVTLAAPGLVVVGAAAAGGLADQPDAELQRGFGGALFTLGLAGGVIGPPLLLHGAWRSSVALGRQAVPVSKSAALIGASLYGGTVVLAALDPEPGPGRAVLLGGGYIGAVGLGAVQLRRNQLAREEAGWFGVVPLRIGETNGLALAGSF